MADFDALLNRWQKAGVLDAEAARRIRAFELELEHPAGLRWQGMVALILGALLLACGVILFVSAHWDDMGPGLRYTLVIGLVAVFHMGGAWAREHFHGLSTALHAVGTVSTGAAIALVGQIFNIQEHWPAAILLWAIAAAAGWILLQDEAQQILTLLLFPAWILSEIMFAVDMHIGDNVYPGSFLIVWAVLYLTFFLGSKRRIVQGILFAVAAIASAAGIVFLLPGWTVWSGEQSVLPLGTRVWIWIVFAALPLLFALFKFRKSVVPVAVSIVFSIALPLCRLTPTEYTYHPGPSLAAHALVAAFAVFIIWWGVHQASKALVNLGMVSFAIAVFWFYYSDIFDKVGRSLGLIGLGILFLAGGWALEKTRRGLMTRMGQTNSSTLEAQ